MHSSKYLNDLYLLYSNCMGFRRASSGCLRQQMLLTGSSAEFKVIINNKIIYVHMDVCAYVRVWGKRGGTKRHESCWSFDAFCLWYYVLLLKHRCWLKWLTQVPSVRRGKHEKFEVCLCTFVCTYCIVQCMRMCLICSLNDLSEIRQKI